MSDQKTVYNMPKVKTKEKTKLIYAWPSRPDGKQEYPTLGYKGIPAQDPRSSTKSNFQNSTLIAISFAHIPSVGCGGGGGSGARIPVILRRRFSGIIT